MAGKAILYGAAYYDEYMPEDRLEADIQLMKRAGISVVRIGESTWSTIEKTEGSFDFSSLDRVTEAMARAGISVIIGTATYAIPAWLAKKHPEILVETAAGRRKFGARQNMDIANPVFRSHAERIIRAVVSRYAGHPAVIGFQADNETKHYGCVSAAWQAAFVAELRQSFGGTDALNKAFGLDYWSNRIDAWEDFPPVEGSINASLSCAYATFQRRQVSRYLGWQVSIINEYKRPDQFVTHNFDFEWRGYSFGIQPDVDHPEASRAFDVVGVDIYHPSQRSLTGREIAFCGDLARSLKHKPYLVMETQAQGFPEWLPFPGQLRLQAFSHLASGAAMVEYWHWHSIHNSLETYWKGLLSHDLAPNPCYEEAVSIGADLGRLGDHIKLVAKKNRIAFVVSNLSLSAFDSFKQVFGCGYNDVLRRFYDALYNLNAECDVVFAEGNPDLTAYSLVIVPALYAATDDFLQKLADFARGGGSLIASFMTGFCDENAKVRHKVQNGLLAEIFGISVQTFTKGACSLVSDPETSLAFGSGEEVAGFMELIQPQGARIIAGYDDPQWKGYAAITEAASGSGLAAYIGCLPSAALATRIMEKLLDDFGEKGKDEPIRFPLICRRGLNAVGKVVRYYLNYSEEERSFVFKGASGEELLEGRKLTKGEAVVLKPWGVAIVEEEA